MCGILYVCGTPIGNIEDITLRCLRIFKEADLIAAEDTRQTVKLLNYYNIKTPLTSYHEHNKVSKGLKIIEYLKEGKNIALVSDAGMPGISDPGEDLIRLCYENGLSVTVVPGATAAVSAAVLSGMSCRSFVFEAFLPSSKKQRRAVIDKMKNESRSIILYEAPHHLIDTLKELYNELGDRNIAAVREITKKHETVNKGSLSDIIEFFSINEPKGEFVIIIEGVSEDKILQEKIDSWSDISIDEHMNLYTAKGTDKKDAMKLVAKDRGVSKREIYAYLNKD